MTDVKYPLKKVMEAVKDSNGIIAKIADRLGCSRMTIYRHIDRYPEVRQAVEDEREALGDLCESAAIELVKGGHGGMIQFFLKTLCKNRGYAERTEVEAGGGN